MVRERSRQRNSRKNARLAFPPVSQFNEKFTYLQTIIRICNAIRESFDPNSKPRFSVTRNESSKITLQAPLCRCGSFSFTCITNTISLEFETIFSASSVEILTTSVVDLEIVDWGLKIFALKPNSRERLEKFSVGFQLNYLGEFIGASKHTASVSHFNAYMIDFSNRSFISANKRLQLFLPIQYYSSEHKPKRHNSILIN